MRRPRVAVGQLEEHNAEDRHEQHAHEGEADCVDDEDDDGEAQHRDEERLPRAPATAGARLHGVVHLAQRVRGLRLQALALVREREREPAVEDDLRGLDADDEELVQLVALQRVPCGQWQPHVLSGGHIVVREHVLYALREGLVQQARVRPAALDAILDGEHSSRKNSRRRQGAGVCVAGVDVARVASLAFAALASASARSRCGSARSSRCSSERHVRWQGQ